MKVCILCNKKKTLNEYYKPTHSKCKTCTLQYNKEYVTKHRINNPDLYKAYNKTYNKKIYKETKEIVNSIKQKSGCKKCGEQRYWILDFHHVDPTKKEHGISTLQYNSNVLKQELKKCIVLCKNCHSDFHHLERTQSITINDYLTI